MTRPSESPQLGANLRRALVLAEQVEGRKKSRVLAEIGAALDRGQSDPSIRDLARRADLRPVVVATIVDGLARAGVLEVERGAAGARNRYRLPRGGRSDRPPDSPQSAAAVCLVRSIDAAGGDDLQRPPNPALPDLY